MSAWRQAAQAQQARRLEQHLLRTPSVLAGPQQVETQINGQSVINFSSNDYLGWAGDPQMAEWLNQGGRQHGVGSGASHWVVGHNQAHEALENSIKQWLGVESVALFATGYLANLAAISALGADCAVHQDRLNHASLLQAGQLCASSRRFAHGDVQQLTQRLASATTRCLVVSDGVFSMDGDVAPVQALVQACEQHDALLMIDDAHGFGVLGDAGRGCTQGLAVPLVMGTLGKAIGAGGAFVAGDADYVEWIRQGAKPYTYTTALSPALAFVASRAIERLQNEPEHQAKLSANIAYFTGACQQAGIELLPSNSAVQACVLGDNQRALRISSQLRQQGLWVAAIRPPTVPQGTARLRIALSAAHHKTHLDTLVERLAQCLGKS